MTALAELGRTGVELGVKTPDGAFCDMEILFPGVDVKNIGGRVKSALRGLVPAGNMLISPPFDGQRGPIPPEDLKELISNIPLFCSAGVGGVIGTLLGMFVASRTGRDSIIVPFGVVGGVAGIVAYPLIVQILSR